MDVGDLIRSLIEALGESWANVVGTSGAPVFRRKKDKTDVSRKNASPTRRPDLPGES